MTYGAVYTADVVAPAVDGVPWLRATEPDRPGILRVTASGSSQLAFHDTRTENVVSVSVVPDAGDAWPDARASLQFATAAWARGTPSRPAASTRPAASPMVRRETASNVGKGSPPWELP